MDPTNRRGRRAAELTARESEIADLIAEGKSNRAIAEKLVLSQRTVDAHVASIFRKLEVISEIRRRRSASRSTARSPAKLGTPPIIF